VQFVFYRWIGLLPGIPVRPLSGWQVQFQVGVVGGILVGAQTIKPQMGRRTLQFVISCCA
jgi:hypothetical protein